MLETTVYLKSGKSITASTEYMTISEHNEVIKHQWDQGFINILHENTSTIIPWENIETIVVKKV